MKQQAKPDYISEIKKRPPLVEIFAFALMPNHYHLLIKQRTAKGISQYVSNFQNGFAKYFNIRKERQGGLFQNQFKARWVEDDEQLVHLSRYIHLNPATSFLVEFAQLSTYPSTSYSCYLKETGDDFINTNFVLSIFGSRDKYIKFVADQSDYQQKLYLIKRLISGRE